MHLLHWLVISMWQNSLLSELCSKVRAGGGDAPPLLYSGYFLVTLSPPVLVFLSGGHACPMRMTPISILAPELLKVTDAPSLCCAYITPCPSLSQSL